jgi:ADP-ribose pyrophosphatase YjhB (NUDIX family)
MTIRVRALLLTPANELVTIRRTRPGQEPYSVLPGGGVEDGEDARAALTRELREEIAATADIGNLIYIHDQDQDLQYIYLARARTWSPSPDDRTGPEFTDPSRGQYNPQATPLTSGALAGINLKPDSFARFLLGHLRQGTTLTDLPDLPDLQSEARTRTRSPSDPRSAA